MWYYATDSTGVIVSASDDMRPVGTFPADWTWHTTEEEIVHCHEGKLWLASQKPADPAASTEPPVCHIMYGTGAPPATLPPNTIYCQYE